MALEFLQKMVLLIILRDFLFNSLEEFFLIGGNDGSAILNTFEKYQLNEKKVKKLKPMNFARDELAVAFGTDQKIYAIGGFGGPKKFSFILFFKFITLMKLYKKLLFKCCREV